MLFISTHREPDYEASQKEVSEHFFTDDKGYSQDEIEQILCLDVGQEVNYICHTVRRVE